MSYALNNGLPQGGSDGGDVCWRRWVGVEYKKFDHSTLRDML